MTYDRLYDTEIWKGQRVVKIKLEITELHVLVKETVNKIWSGEKMWLLIYEHHNYQIYNIKIILIQKALELN